MTHKSLSAMARGENSSVTRRRLLECGGSAALLAACCPCYQQSNKSWNNALNLAGVDPKQQLSPGTLKELVEVIQRAEAEKAGVRMTGSGHSFSDVAFSEDYLLSPLKLNKELVLPREQLRAELKEDPNLVRVESGTRLRELNPRLYAKGLALRNMGGWDAQTIVGAAMTGTHGSGIAYGPIASQIASMQLVTTGGVVMQVEPGQGITDPAKFPGFIATAEGNVTAQLMQDDETFNALSVSLGCMGVVYSVVLRVEPRFWLRETRERLSWSAVSGPGGFIDRLVRQQKLDPGTGPDPDYYEIYFNPYPSRPGDPTSARHCLLTRRYKVREEPTHLSLEERTRGRYGSDALRAAAEITGYGARLVEYMNANPRNVPLVLDGALDALEDKGYVDVSYNVFSAGAANLIRAYGIEMAFDVKQTVQAVEHLFVIANELRERKWMHNSPPSLRFVRKSSAHLAMMYGRDTMMLEMGMLTCANGGDGLLQTYEKRFMQELQARPHWGLDLNVLSNFDQVRALYPESADRWRAVYQRFNSKGTFNANFTDRLGISLKV
jgi:hypothetical protein